MRSKERAPVPYCSGQSVRAGMSVADFGCGPGIVTRQLAHGWGPSGQVVGSTIAGNNWSRPYIRQRAAASTTLCSWKRIPWQTDFPLPRSMVIYLAVFLLCTSAAPEAALHEVWRLFEAWRILICEDGDLTAAGSMPVSARYNALRHFFGQLAPESVEWIMP